MSPHFVKLLSPHRGCPKSFKSMIAPHTLSNFSYPPHFVKLSEFDKVVQPSSHTRLCQLADFPSLNLRSTFAQGSLKVCPRWRKLAACAQFKIHNSNFIILPHSPLIFPLPSPYLPLILCLRLTTKLVRKINHQSLTIKHYFVPLPIETAYAART